MDFISFFFAIFLIFCYYFTIKKLHNAIGYLVVKPYFIVADKKEKENTK